MHDDWLDDDLLRQVGEQVLRVHHRRSRPYAGSRLDASAFRILWRLVEHEPLTLGELTDQLELERSTVNRQVNAAIGHGLVERYAVPGRASRLLRVTEAGAEAYRHDLALRVGTMREALADLGPEQARALVSSLAAFNDAMEAAHTRADVDASGALGDQLGGDLRG